jgi:hypothetical protein
MSNRAVYDAGTMEQELFPRGHAVVAVKIANDTQVNDHTTITSSPMTSTSGRRKCFNAVIPARHAQPSIFPESDKKCNVSLMCHT